MIGATKERSHRRSSQQDCCVVLHLSFALKHFANLWMLCSQEARPESGLLKHLAPTCISADSGDLIAFNYGTSGSAEAYWMACWIPVLEADMGKGVALL